MSLYGTYEIIMLQMFSKMGSESISFSFLAITGWQRTTNLTLQVQSDTDLQTSSHVLKLTSRI